MIKSQGGYHGKKIFIINLLFTSAIVILNCFLLAMSAEFAECCVENQFSNNAASCVTQLPCNSSSRFVQCTN